MSSVSGSGAEGGPVTRHIARLALAARTLPASADVHEALLRSLVDTLACIVGAHAAAPVAGAREAAIAFDAVSTEADGATIVGTDTRVTVHAAAFVNGLAARYLDYNDIYLGKEGVHPSDVVSVVLALAEARRSSGAAALAALASAYEVHCRLAEAVTTRRGGWDHSLLNAIASAVAAGILLDLDEVRLAHAIAIAAVANVPLMETRVGELSAWKAAASPYAARAGVFAAVQACHGLDAPRLVFEGRHGLYAQVTGPAEPGCFELPITEARLLGVHLKAWPIGYFTQPAVDAALALRAHFDPGRTTRIVIETTEFGRLANADGPAKWRPRTRETADHSLPYGVAVALLDGQVGEAQFTPERIARADVQDLMQRIEVVENPDFTAAYPPAVGTRLSFFEHERCVRQWQVDHPRGHARNPMSRAEIDAKFLDLCPSAEVAAVLPAWWNVARHDAAALARLVHTTLAGARRDGGVPGKAPAP